MAINAIVLDTLIKLAQRLPAPRRMFCLGYPDMLVTEAQLERLCGVEIARNVSWRVFYHDWYTQSGNALVTPCYAMHGTVLGSRLTVLDPTAGFVAPERAVLLVAAMKAVAAPPGWPMQSKYVRNSELKG